jgi:hypothetical protein
LCAACSTAPRSPHLVSILPDGARHSVAVWIGTHGDHVVILAGAATRKARNLRRDPRVAALPDTSRQPLPAGHRPRTRVIEWLADDAAWTTVDQQAIKYTGQP